MRNKASMMKWMSKGKDGMKWGERGRPECRINESSLDFINTMGYQWIILRMDLILSIYFLKEFTWCLLHFTHKHIKNKMIKK